MLIFDFDGILLDSVVEVAVNAYNTVTGRLCTSTDELPEGCVESFVRNRYHFRAAGESLNLMSWCIETGASAPGRLLTPAEYVGLLAVETVPIAERTEKFFAARGRFAAKDRRAWLGMNRPYEPIWGELRKAGAGRVVILTNKNREAVVELTHHFGLEIDGKNVYSGDKGRTKTENLNELHGRFGATHYVFVDDSLGNLRELRDEFASGPFELRLGLGAWGYIGPDDRNEAAAEDFPIFEQQDIIDLLQKELPK